MDPLEIVSNALYDFDEKELFCNLLNAFGKKSTKFEQFNLLAKIFFEKKYFNESMFYGEKSILTASSQKEKDVTIKNLINVYNQNNYPKKALSKIKQLKNKKHVDDEILLEETFSYSAINEKDKSDKLLFSLLKKKLSPEIKRKAYHNLSGYYFRRDDIKNGLKHFLKSSEVEAYKNTKVLSFPKWDGKIVPGKTIIIDNQCGAGDEVMHVRFMKRIKDLGMNPIWLTTRKDIQKIFNYNGFCTKLVWDKPKFPNDSEWVYSLALPYYLNLESNELGREPYLKPLDKKEKKYSYLKKDEKFKIGVFWNSGSGFEQAHFRCIDPIKLFEVLTNTNAKLFSFQFPDTPPPEKYKDVVNTFDIPNRNFEDTFSLVSQMDLIVTSCTSLAHIAASMGKEVCVLTPIMEYYVWTSSHGKSWWYGDHVHIFKQKKPREWDEPISELEVFLGDRGI